MPAEEKPASCPRRVLLISVVLGLAGALGACGGPWRDAYFKKEGNAREHDRKVRPRGGRRGPASRTPMLGQRGVIG